MLSLCLLKEHHINLQNQLPYLQFQGQNPHIQNVNNLESLMIQQDTEDACKAILFK